MVFCTKPKVYLSAGGKVGAGFFVTWCYVDNSGKPIETYPLAQTSPQAITGLTTPDGRFSIMMPHAERVFRAVQNSWYPKEWKENGRMAAHVPECEEVGGKHHSRAECVLGFNPYNHGVLLAGEGESSIG